MRRRVSFSFMVLGLLASPMLGSAQAPDPGRVARGQALYAEQRCNLCHSIGDVGNRRGPLDDVGRRLTADALERWLVEPAVMTRETGATRKPDMPAYARLSADDLAALVAYMETLRSE